jgi:peptidyl-prolyl cis-trans isomerase SurA
MKPNFERRRARALLLIALLAAAAAVRAGVELDRIVAVVNGDVILFSELDGRMRQVMAQLEQQGTPAPPRQVLEKQVLDRLILTNLQVQMAAESGIKVDDETLNRTISNIAAENKLSIEQFRDILEQDGYSYERFREEMRNEILLSRLQQRQVENRVTVSEREVENFLSTQDMQGDTETEYRLRHILVAIPDSPSADEAAEAEQLAQNLWQELKDGGDFATLATSHSDGQQALEGGDLGWRKAGQIPSLFAPFIPEMKPGDISEMIRSPSGFHIIKLEDTRSGEKTIITQTHSRHILIRVDELTTESDARRKAEQLKHRLDLGDDFAELAKSHSQDPVSAGQGGDLGWTNPGELVPDFENMMNALEPGAISPPFETQYGFHILQVLERRQHDGTEELKRNRAREIIRRRKLEEARETWLRQLRDEAYVEYRLAS